MKFNAFGKIFSIIAMLTLVFALTFAVSITASAEENTDPPVTGGTEPTFSITATQSEKDYRDVTFSWNEVPGTRYCVYIDYEHVAVITEGTSYELTMKGDEEVTVVIDAIDENDVTIKSAVLVYKNHRIATKKTNVVEVTCVTDGSHTLVTYCSLCKEELNTEDVVITATGHKLEEKVVNPTCTKDGYTADVCTNPNCDYKENVRNETSKKGHNSNGIIPAVAATCTTDGNTAGKKCTGCGKIMTPVTPIYAAGHTWNEATCQTPKTCTVCSETSGKAVDHKFSPDTDPEAIFVKEVCEFCGEKGKFVKVQIPPAHKDTVIKVAVVTACVIVIILAIKGLVAPPSTTPWWKRRR